MNNVRQRSRPLSKGFTIVEMMIVVAIIGILASIAVPSFNTMIDGQRAKNAASDIYIALARARSEALRVNQNVTLTPKSGTTDWASGWSIADPLHAGSLLDDHEALRSLTVTGPTSIIYKSSGRVTLAGALVKFTISGNYPQSTRYVCLDLSGRPSINTSGTCT